MFLPLNFYRFPEPPDLCMQQPSDEDVLETPRIDLMSKERSPRIRTFPHFCPPDTILVDDKCLKSCTANTMNYNFILYKVRIFFTNFEFTLKYFFLFLF